MEQKKTNPSAKKTLLPCLVQLAVSANNVTSLLWICVKPLRNTVGVLGNAEVSVVVVEVVEVVLVVVVYCLK